MPNANDNNRKLAKLVKTPKKLNEELEPFIKANIIKKNFEADKRNFDSCLKFLSQIFSKESDERDESIQEAKQLNIVSGTLDPGQFIRDVKALKFNDFGMKLKIFLSEALGEVGGDELVVDNKMLKNAKERYEALKEQTIQASETSAGREANGKLASIKKLISAKSIKEATKLLDKVYELIANNDEDDGEPLMDKENLLVLMRKADSEKYPFVCGTHDKGFSYMMHLNKPPKPLFNNFKRELGPGKFCYGFVTLDDFAKLLVLDVEKTTFSAKVLVRQMKLWLRENKPLPAKGVCIMMEGAMVPCELPEMPLADASPDRLLEVIDKCKETVMKALSRNKGNLEEIRSAWEFIQQHGSAFKKTNESSNREKVLKALLLLDSLLGDADLEVQSNTVRDKGVLPTFQLPRLSAVEGIKKLEAKLRLAEDPRATEIADIIQKLYETFPDHLEKILEKFDEAISIKNEGAVSELKKQGLKAVQYWKAFLTKHAVKIEGCEKNPWNLEVSIKNPLNSVLDNLEQEIFV